MMSQRDKRLENLGYILPIVLFAALVLVVLLVVWWLGG